MILLTRFAERLTADFPPALLRDASAGRYGTENTGIVGRSSERICRFEWLERSGRAGFMSTREVLAE